MSLSSRLKRGLWASLVFFTLRASQAEHVRPLENAQNCSLAAKAFVDPGFETIPNQLGRELGLKVLNPEELQQAELFVRDGKIYDAQNRLFDTTDGTHNFAYSGCAIFVMDSSGRIFASKTAIDGVLHHTSLLGPNARVAAAGEITVLKGQLNALSNRSGHYKPSVKIFEQVHRVLIAGGIDPVRIPQTTVQVRELGPGDFGD